MSLTVLESGGQSLLERRAEIKQVKPATDMSAPSTMKMDHFRSNLKKAPRRQIPCGCRVGDLRNACWRTATWRSTGRTESS